MIMFFGKRDNPCSDCAEVNGAWHCTMNCGPSGEIEKVTNAEWKRAHRNDYARIWDGRRYMLRIDKATGATVWRPVDVIINPSRPYQE